MWVLLLLQFVLLVVPLPTSIGALANDILSLKAHEQLVVNGSAFTDSALDWQSGGDVSLSYAPLEPQTFKILPIAAAKKDQRPRRKPDSHFNFSLTAKSVYVMDKASGARLYEIDADTPRPIASLTKLMSAAIFLNNGKGKSSEAFDWNKTIVIDNQDGLQGRLYLEPGEEIKVEDLFFTSLTGSSNNATMALARASGLGIDQFVKEMNTQAKKWGLLKTVFVEPTGLNQGNQSTAREAAKMLNNALGLEKVRQATTIKNYSFKTPSGVEHAIPSTDELLLTDLGPSKIKKINGGKTGFIEEAGFNFAVEVEDGFGHQIIVVVLGSLDHLSRFVEAKELAEWIFSSYLWPDQVGFESLVASGF